MPNKEYKLNIEGPEISLSLDLDYDEVRRILPLVFGGNTSAKSEVNLNDGTIISEDRSSPEPASGLSVGEFIADLNVTSNVDRIAAISLYLNEEMNQPKITKKDISDWFQKAGEAAPKNLPRDINNAVKRRLIAEDTNDSGHYFVTLTGTKHLRENS